MDLLPICDKALKIALNIGCDEAEIYASTIKRIEVFFEKNDLQIARSQIEDGIGIRAFKNKGLGFSSVNSFDEKKIEEAVRNSYILAKSSPKDDFNQLPKSQKITKIKGIYDPDSKTFSTSNALKFGLMMINEAKNYDRRVTVDSASFETVLGESAIVNSSGIRIEESSSLFNYYIMGMAVDGEEVSSFNYQFDGKRFINEIDVKTVALEFAKNVIGSLGAERGESFVGNVILSPNSVFELLIPSLLFSINANNVQKNMSKLSGKIGERVASNLLTITDNGLLLYGLGSSSFDREGVPHKPINIIENGKLISYMYNTYTANKEGRLSTGHASGGARTVPGIGPTNFIIKSGDVNYEDMISNIDKGIIVTRFSGNTNPVSGDFSGVVKGGYLIKNGKITKPIIETLIAGNIFEALPKICAISKETKWVYSTNLPYIAIEDVHITSG
jgi:PmbA protein